MIHEPDWIYDLYMPDEIDFYYPQGDSIVELDDDSEIRYQQFVNWSMIQSFWYYVIGKPAVCDEAYQRIRQEIINLESEFDYLLTYTAPHIPLGCSPTVTWWNWNWSRYPPYIIDLFSGMKYNMQIPFPIVRKKEEARERSAVEKLESRRKVKLGLSFRK